MSHFKEQLLNTIIDYTNKFPNHYKSSLITQCDNKEFDDLFNN